MGIDAREFRRSLGQFASGVTVVTTRDAAGQPQGLTASSFCSVSLDPPLVLVCVDNRLGARRAIEESGLFAVSVLRESQESVSRRFASRGTDKFAGWRLVSGASGLPLVSGALAHIECRLADAHLARATTPSSWARSFASRPLRGGPSFITRAAIADWKPATPPRLAGAPVRDRV